jgi:hypothetical protein
MLMFSPYQKILIDILREKIGEKYQTGVECKKNEHTAFFGTLNTTIVRAAGRRKSAQAQWQDVTRAQNRAAERACG